MHPKSFVSNFWGALQNVFVLRALEVAGMRLPVQDPGYAKSVLSAGR